MAEKNPIFMDISGVYSGDELGLPFRHIVREGVNMTENANALKVQAKGSPDLSVDVLLGSCWVKGDTDVNNQPTYLCLNDATENLGITPDASNPRKVLIIAQVTDQAFAGSGRKWELLALHGTPAASPSEPAVPASAIVLALIDVTAADASISNAQITDRRTPAGSILGGGGSELPIDLLNPQAAANAGNAVFGVETLTDYELASWAFLANVDGKLFGRVRIPSDAVIGASPQIVLELLANATTGVTRMSVATKAVADGESLNPSALTSETAQDVTVPATARLRKKVSFPLTEALAAGDVVIVEIFHEGAHANDTLAVNTQLVGAALKLN